MSLTEDSCIDFDIFSIILFSIFKEINPATLEFELTDEEIKLHEVEQDMHYSDTKYDFGLSAHNLASPTPVQGDMIDFVDPYNQINVDENNDCHLNSTLNKEITIIPLNQVDYHEDVYNSKRFSAK